MYNTLKFPLASVIAAFSIFSCKKLREQDFYENYPDIKNFTAGGIAGFIAGNIVGPIEATKVRLQVSPKYTSVFNILKNDWRGLLNVSFPFGIIFGSVCALEFSVNHKIGEHHGKVFGIIASAITGSAFLTAADHIMFRMHKGQSPANTIVQFYGNKPSTLWTGFSPMFVREAISIINVMITGPMLGKAMKNVSVLKNDSSKDELFWNTLGRYPANMIGTIISHPFDSLARELQKELHEIPHSVPKVTKIIKKIDYWRYWRGLLPRMMLAPVGLTFAGSGFDFFKIQLTNPINTENESNKEYIFTKK